MKDALPPKRRPRRWYLSARALLVFLAIPVVAVSTLDGVNAREIISLLLVLAFGFVIAARADRLQDRLDELQSRLHHHDGRKHR